MKLWSCRAIGNLIVVEASTMSAAWREAKELASSCSALPSDVSRPRLATDEEIAWYRAMGGAV